MHDDVNLIPCFTPFYGINPLHLFFFNFYILVRDLLFKIMVALADMIVMLDDSYFHIFS